mmetsp:Transcript_4411/g.16158  ORF Transcript_4411/g.16158 Transcript_4411/m.16158 type:complete len:299 (+) Transcript_4411:156-1052(+)
MAVELRSLRNDGSGEKAERAASGTSMSFGSMNAFFCASKRPATMKSQLFLRMTSRECPRPSSPPWYLGSKSRTAVSTPTTKVAPGAAFVLSTNSGAFVSKHTTPGVLNCASRRRISSTVSAPLSALTTPISYAASAAPGGLVAAAAARSSRCPSCNGLNDPLSTTFARVAPAHVSSPPMNSKIAGADGESSSSQRSTTSRGVAPAHAYAGSSSYVTTTSFISDSDNTSPTKSTPAFSPAVSAHPSSLARRQASSCNARKTNRDAHASSANLSLPLALLSTISYVANLPELFAATKHLC